MDSLNDRRIFVTRSSADFITCDTIRRRLKTCSIPFFDFNVELSITSLGGSVFDYRISSCAHSL